MEYIKWSQFTRVLLNPSAITTKKHLALKVVQNKQTITEAAQKNNVSRKFIHKLKDKAIGGIQLAFQENNSKEQKVLLALQELMGAPK